MNFIKQVNKTWLFCGLIMLLAIGIRCYKFSDKESLFSDEYMSIIISLYHNADDPYWYYNNIDNDSVVYSGREVKSLALSDDNSIWGVLHDLSKLRHSTRDLPHTSLYYSLLRISFLGADTSDMPQVILRGFLLNLFFFLLSFLFLYKLSSRLFTNKIFVICSLAIAFLNPASVANTLFLRPYQLQETLFVLFSYILTLCCFSIIEKRRVSTWQNMLVLSFITALTLLTGYFSVFYVLFSGLFLLFLLYKEKNKEDMKFFFWTFLLAYIFVIAIYAGYNDGWLFWKSSRAREAVDKLDLSSGFFLNLVQSLDGLYTAVTEYFLSVPILFLLFLSLVGGFFFGNKKVKGGSVDKIKYRMPLFLSLLGFIWILIVMLLAPYKLIRYIMPVLPIVSLFVPFLLSHLQDKVQVLLTVVFSFCLLVQVTITNVCLEALIVPDSYREHPEIPLVVGGYEDWQQPGLIPFWTDERTVELSKLRNNKSENDCFYDFENKVNKYNDLYVITQTKFSHIYIVPKGYRVEDRFDIGDLLQAYRLKRE